MSHYFLRTYMKLEVEKVPGISIAVLHSVTPRIWKLNPTQGGGPKKNDTGCFVAREAKRPWVELGTTGIKLPGNPPALKQLQGRKVSDIFMSLSTELEFLDFLNQVGRFSSLDQVEKEHGWKLKEFLACQGLFAELAKHPPEGWNACADRSILKNSHAGLAILNAIAMSTRYTVEFHWTGSPAWNGAQHVALIETKDVLATMLAIIQIDHLRGAKFGICARADCPRFFEIKSRHIRKYCSYDCAHLETVRRSRQKASRKQGSGRGRAASKRTTSETPRPGLKRLGK
jgi:hypothetical protein